MNGKDDRSQETKHIIYKTALGEQLKVECLSCGKQVLAQRKTWEQTAISKKWEEMERELNKIHMVPNIDIAWIDDTRSICAPLAAPEILSAPGVPEIQFQVPAPTQPAPTQYRSQETPMIGFNPDEAQEEKWKRGQEKYGPGSLPVCPLAHCYEELIDALNYLDYARNQGEITVEEHQLTTGIIRTAAYWAKGKHFQVEKK